MPNYSKSEYDDRREAALIRHDALRKQDMAFKREMQGTFEQGLAARKALEGDFRQRSDLQRELQGTWDQKAAQERLIQGTFPEREAGLNTRQAARHRGLG